MPFKKITLQPGVNLEWSQTQNVTQWADGDNIRFYAGLPEKREGWTALESTALTGTGCAILGWGDFSDRAFVAIATNSNLYVFNVASPTPGDITGISFASQTALKAQCSLDHFGADLIACPHNQQMVYWVPPVIVANPAIIVPNSPANTLVAFVMSQIQMIVAAGASAGGGGGAIPTLVRWCDAGDFTAWTPSATNQAGSFQLPTGSKIISGLAMGLGALIWTDLDLYSMTYDGLPFVFSFNKIASACEPLSMRSPVTIGTAVIWPSSNQFFKYDGNGVYPIECPVWDWFYNNYDNAFSAMLHGAVNSHNNEVTWFFPVKGSSGATINYVKYNVVENIWDKGTLGSLAWFDHPPGLTPVRLDQSNAVQQHNVGVDANGAAITWFIQTGYFDIADGEEFAFVDMLIPDFQNASPSSASIQITILALDYPGDTPRTYGPFTITPLTEFVNVRARGRQMAIKIGGSDIGSSVRLGAIRYRWARDGRR